jgi:hypothetical protein
MYFTPLPCYLVPLRHKYSTQHPILTRCCSYSSSYTCRPQHKTLAYSVRHARRCVCSARGVSRCSARGVNSCWARGINRKFSVKCQTCDLAVCVDINCFLLPQQDKYLTLFMLFNWISLHKIGGSAGNIGKGNLKFETFINSFQLKQ